MRRSGRILIVDDEPTIAEVLRLFLAPPHHVSTARSAVVALASLDAGDRYDVILCDVSMPEMSGPAFHDALVLRAPELAEQAARMVFMTGGVSNAALRGRLEALNLPILDKPFDMKLVRDVVSERVALREISEDRRQRDGRR